MQIHRTRWAQIRYALLKRMSNDVWEVQTRKAVWVPLQRSKVRRWLCALDAQDAVEPWWGGNWPLLPW